MPVIVITSDESMCTTAYHNPAKTTKFLCFYQQLCCCQAWAPIGIFPERGRG